MTRPLDRYTLEKAKLAEQSLRILAMQALRADGVGEQDASERIRKLFKAIHALAARIRSGEVEVPKQKICDEWCGRKHCAPPNYCFYAVEVPNNAAGQVPAMATSGADESGQVSRDPSHGERLDTNASGFCPAPAAPSDTPRPLTSAATQQSSEAVPEGEFEADIRRIAQEIGTPEAIAFAERLLAAAPSGKE